MSTGLEASIVTPGSTAPDASLTTPAIDAVSCWAIACVGSSASTPSNAVHFANRTILSTSLNKERHPVYREHTLQPCSAECKEVSVLAKTLIVKTFQMTRIRVSSLAIPLLMAIMSAGCMQRTPARDAGVTSILPDGLPSTFFVAGSIGDGMRAEERPRVAQVQIVDLDQDGLADVIVCDALRDTIGWIRQSPRGTYTET